MVAQDEATAKHAAHVIEIEYEDLPPIFSIKEAVDKSSFFPLVKKVGRQSPVGLDYTHSLLDIDRKRRCQGCIQGCLRHSRRPSEHRFVPSICIRSNTQSSCRRARTFLL